MHQSPSAVEEILIPTDKQKTMSDIPIKGTVSVSEILAYMEQDRYLSKKDAANYLGLSVRGMSKHLAAMSCYRIGKKLLFRKSELDDWMEQFKEEPRKLDLRRLLDDAVEQARRNVERRRTERREGSVISQNVSQQK
jgi:excisionase family DNA binding protein